MTRGQIALYVAMDTVEYGGIIVAIMVAAYFLP